MTTRLGVAARMLLAFASAAPLMVLFVAALSIPLSAAERLELTPPQISAWIVSIYGVCGLVSIALTLRYRQPLLITGNLLAIIYLASLGGEVAYPELIGATMLAGAGVLALGLLGLTGRLARWIPTPIVLGLLAAVVFPFVSGIFTDLGSHPASIGSALAAFLLSRALLSARVPAILPAMVAGLLAASASGSLGPVPGPPGPPLLALTAPAWSVSAILTVTPVLIVLITLQANVPSVVYLRSQGYAPPERTVNVVTGAGTGLASVLGPSCLSIPMLVVPFTAGPSAGEAGTRHWSVYFAAGALLVIALLAGGAGAVVTWLPVPLLFALAGLQLIDVFVGAWKTIVGSGLILGPAFTFAVALSDLSLAGLGPPFWGLASGIAVSLLLERRALVTLRARASAPPER